ncbi:MAG TPA: 1-pyrroline-5-carboxylate dehydrogenase, partial [Calditrichia bacterium]|nr:1-pyrroline-5-carboxylate dehydrogenase [Calditrichia bacterium]
MSNAYFKVPYPDNEPILSYGPGTPEKDILKATLEAMAAQEIEIPLIIGGKEVRTGNTADITAPHDHSLKLGTYHKAGEKEVQMAIKAAVE